MTDDADISQHPNVALSEETRDFIAQDEIMHPVKIMRKKMKQTVAKMFENRYYRYKTKGDMC